MTEAVNDDTLVLSDNPFEFKLAVIRRKGEIEAIRDHIWDLKGVMEEGCFIAIKKADRYCRLSEALKDGQKILDEMKAAFELLKTLEDGHK